MGQHSNSLVIKRLGGCDDASLHNEYALAEVTAISDFDRDAAHKMRA
jgi:hypothetical protein